MTKYRLRHTREKFYFGGKHLVGAAKRSSVRNSERKSNPVFHNLSFDEVKLI